MKIKFISESVDNFLNFYLLEGKVSDVLKPKQESEIDEKINPIIDNFVNNVSTRDFNEIFKDAIDSKKLIQNGKLTYLTNLNSLIEIIENLALKESDTAWLGKNSMYFKFPEFGEIWINMTQGDLHHNYFDKFLIKVVNKLADKFNIEW